jgi:hypothetical protein
LDGPRIEAASPEPLLKIYIPASKPDVNSPPFVIRVRGILLMSDDDIGQAKRATLFALMKLLDDQTRKYNKLRDQIKPRNKSDQRKFESLQRQATQIDQAVTNPSSIGPLTSDEHYDRVVAMIEHATEEFKKINRALRALIRKQ